MCMHIYTYTHAQEHHLFAHTPQARSVAYGRLEGCKVHHSTRVPKIMEKGGVREERRSRSPQGRKEILKPMSAVEEVNKEPQYVVDREKVRRCQFTLFEAQSSPPSERLRTFLSNAANVLTRSCVCCLAATFSCLASY